MRSNNLSKSDSIRDEGFRTPKAEAEICLSEDDAMTQSVSPICSSPINTIQFFFLKTCRVATVPKLALDTPL